MLVCENNPGGRAMIYNEKFKRAVELAGVNGLYLGTGNPNAKILIVGKELGINPDTQKGVATNEIDENIPKWKENIDTNASIEIIKELECNPLFPYKGQQRKKYDGKCNGGTSNTWLNYQKLHDQIYGNSAEEIIFHKDFFLTEINQPPSTSSNKQDKAQRIESIECRTKFFRDNDFFQSFPIVILTCRSYVPDPKSLFSNIFLEGEELLNISGNPCKRYFSSDKSKLIIVTRQLSNSLDRRLLSTIALEVKSFLNKDSY